MAILMWIGWGLLMVVANQLIGYFTGFMLGGAVLAALTFWIQMKTVDAVINRNIKKNEKALKEYYEQEEQSKNPEEEFEKLPAWKRVELMKQKEAEEQK